MPFSLNRELFQQIDGVCMGFPLGPTLADIIMTTLEEVIRPLISSDTTKFYARFVDDTLVLANLSSLRTLIIHLLQLDTGV